MEEKSLIYGLPHAQAYYLVLTVVQGILDAGNGSNDTGVVGDLAVSEGNVKVDTNEISRWKNKKTRKKSDHEKREEHHISTLAECEKKKMNNG